MSKINKNVAKYGAGDIVKLQTELAQLSNWSHQSFTGVRALVFTLIDELALDKKKIVEESAVLSRQIMLAEHIIHQFRTIKVDEQQLTGTLKEAKTNLSLSHRELLQPRFLNLFPENIRAQILLALESIPLEQR
jgi:hypothetical protein